jgi:hypothetical protein
MRSFRLLAAGGASSTFSFHHLLLKNYFKNYKEVINSEFIVGLYRIFFSLSPFSQKKSFIT